MGLLLLPQPFQGHSFEFAEVQFPGSQDGNLIYLNE